ncbi:MAG: hypothetical protein PF572_00495 [Patescibacteria group bacterium]|jgi:predicted translin family RNA/ssDNA-binding protein|nr:hypothetical protein [Patescibacteria group bacterium]
MLNKNFFFKLKKEYAKNDIERRKIISQSNVLLHNSKRIIFSLHRGDLKQADVAIEEIKKELVRMQKGFTYTRLAQEGSYKAAVEEFIEAAMFQKFITGKKVDKIEKIVINYDSYLGGICDLTGEMVRFGVNKASNKEFGEVTRIKEAISDIISQLADFDMTGYLRTKYDQAKGNLRKIEQINYEISIRSIESR